MKKNKEISTEKRRISESTSDPVPPWQKWGPYVSERSWGSVREDYSANGDAWNYFPFDLAHIRAYRWGEDAIAGWCDRYQILTFAPVFWNGKDPILKERLFGVSSPQGNHGEDVKECYFYLDGIPSHSYMKYLYKYPHDEFPYKKLIEENGKRTTHDPEYELIDTGVFAHGKYFDIFIEYIKVSPEDTCVRIEAINRWNESAPLHILPHLWFRNTWAWGDDRSLPGKIIDESSSSELCLIADDEHMMPLMNLPFSYRLGKRYLYASKGGATLFTDNETHPIGHELPNHYYKDGFHRHVIDREETVNPEKKGSKACIHYYFEKVPPGQSAIVYLRLTGNPMEKPLDGIDKLIEEKIKEADEFYSEVHPLEASKEERQVQRQALASILWSKQIYLFDVDLWLKGDNTIHSPPASRLHIRNIHWRHLNSMRILLMPDKWEYPWFAAWDQAYHCVPLGLIDIELAKEQLWLLLFDQFQHPNGQIPAYEWEFSDLNPPVQAWAVLQLHDMEKEQKGSGDLLFLERCFHKLLMNFSWWVNKVDSSGNNVFEGGFLGMDNISLVDRSHPLSGGVKLQQSDGTGWMALFCLNLMRMALILSERNRVYESLATKFFEHYVYIAHAMSLVGSQNYELWSDRDGFFYDVLTYPNGRFAKFRVRSLVGIIPLFALDVIDEEELKKYPEFRRNFDWFLANRRSLVQESIISLTVHGQKTYVLTPMSQNQLASVLRYIWDPNEFRSEFGMRSLSKYHQDHPFIFEDRKIGYEPAESIEKLKGGNSNWRGPIWMQTNYMLIEVLKKLSSVFGKEMQVQVEGEKSVDLKEMSDSFATRIISLFTKDKHGVRPIWGDQFPYYKDPYWKDHILFYEYFHGDTGRGLGASHQGGWSALVANVIDQFRR